MPAKYRKWGFLKDAQEFRAKVGDEIFEYFDSIAVSPRGVRRGRGQLLEMMVSIVSQLPREVFEMFDSDVDREISVTISTKKRI